jgi:thiamine-monophosphate kinase
VSGERDLIARIRARLPADPAWVHVGIGDDAAVIEPERNLLEVLTTDTMVEGVHWDPRFCSPPDVGHKALAVNLSDIASMGAVPRAALLSLSVGPRWAETDADGFIDAFAGVARDYGVTLVGGNVTGTPGPATITVTLTGTVHKRRVLTRSAARPGDDLYVTGSIGAARAGLVWLQANPVLDEPSDPALAECVRRYRRPEPRTRVGVLLGRTRGASACIDLSDGFADAVRQVTQSSGTGARIDAASIPVPEAAAALFSNSGEDPIAAAVRGGDDYELLLAVPAKRRRTFEAVRRLTRGVPLTRVGTLTSECEVL